MDPFHAWRLLRQGWTAEEINKAIRFRKSMMDCNVVLRDPEGIERWHTTLVQLLNNYGRTDESTPSGTE